MPQPRPARLWLFGLLLVARLAAEPLATIKTAGDFWNVPTVERDKPHPVDMELTVYYYDPVWRLIWGDSAGNAVYLPLRGGSAAGSQRPARSAHGRGRPGRWI